MVRSSGPCTAKSIFAKKTTSPSDHKISPQSWQQLGDDFSTVGTKSGATESVVTYSILGRITGPISLRSSYVLEQEDVTTRDRKISNSPVQVGGGSYTVDLGIR